MLYTRQQKSSKVNTITQFWTTRSPRVYATDGNDNTREISPSLKKSVSRFSVGARPWKSRSPERELSYIKTIQWLQILRIFYVKRPSKRKIRPHPRNDVNKAVSESFTRHICYVANSSPTTIGNRTKLLIASGPSWVFILPAVFLSLLPSGAVYCLRFAENNAVNRIYNTQSRGFFS